MANSKHFMNQIGNNLFYIVYLNFILFVIFYHPLSNPQHFKYKVP